MKPKKPAKLPPPISENETELERVIRESEHLHITIDTKRKAVSAFREAIAEMAKAQALLDATQATLDDASAEMVRQYKKECLKLDGQVLIASSRGPRIFYKRMNELSVVNL